MSESGIEPADDSDFTLGLDSTEDEAISLDEVVGSDNVYAVYDTSYSPPERPLGVHKFGTTFAEQRDGETLEQRIAQEEPDPAMEVDLVEGEPAVRAGEGGDVPDGIDTGTGEAPDSVFEDGVLDDGEVGELRAGRLVDPDEGVRGDAEKDMVGFDVGIDGGAASAEEAAMHIVGGDDLAIDEGSSI